MSIGLDRYALSLKYLPMSLQENLIKLREVDVKVEAIMKHTDRLIDEYLKNKFSSEEKKKERLVYIQSLHARANRYAELKVKLSCHTYELVNRNVKRLSYYLSRFEEEIEEECQEKDKKYENHSSSEDECSIDEDNPKTKIGDRNNVGNEKKSIDSNNNKMGNSNSAGNDSSSSSSSSSSDSDSDSDNDSDSDSDSSSTTTNSSSNSSSSSSSSSSSKSSKTSKSSCTRNKTPTKVSTNNHKRKKQISRKSSEDEYRIEALKRLRLQSTSSDLDPLQQKSEAMAIKCERKSGDSDDDNSSKTLRKSPKQSASSSASEVDVSQEILNPSKYRKGNTSKIQVYCMCRQEAYGDMIACDDPECIVEWYHFDCVSLRKAPKGKWYCRACVQNRKKIKPNIYIH